mmetsp:Transcript_48934/g.72739  ORF Transcript_48934/g.72739 Transcript_48934/m.72739 type:complete len:511 (+) Transcript_48934:132-1664(+)|eukprot:CAMPEP_0195527674 /NCGR_PEP_ID=MMETSP0794_2-20130614/29527_1 /TAXON_ID=515487 /ORGANISM="Stephanopyxis turris, Strain CCMP 815" /LENGTH=510 /DNA_ID=CAMNT_0040658647 /DNA_START=130 /DNA_END=1662 /DNA_ORIENTATION=+
MKLVAALLTLGAVLDANADPGDPEVYSGEANSNSGFGSVIMGGYANTVDASAVSSTLMGGDTNLVEAQQSVLVGGSENQILGSSTALETIIGGQYNRAQAKQAAVIAGRTNRAKARYSSIGGGYNNLVTGRFSGIPGGSGNTVRGKYGSVLGNYGTVRKDNSMIVNTLGTRKVLDAENTFAVHVSKMYINSHDVEEVYSQLISRQRRLDEELVSHVQNAHVEAISQHVSEQNEELANRVAELRRAVSEISSMVKTQVSDADASRRQLRSADWVSASNSDQPEDSGSGITSVDNAANFASASGSEEGDDVHLKTFLRAQHTATTLEEFRHVMQNNPGYLRSVHPTNFSDGVLSTAQQHKPSTEAPKNRKLQRKWNKRRAEWRRTLHDERVRRRLVNTNSDYPKDGSMVQDYQVTITARMDDIDSRIDALQTRLATQDTYFTEGQLVGDFDCTDVRPTYGEGPCNICGPLPRLQFRASDPVTGGPAVFVCDGSGEFGLADDITQSGEWLKLV